MRSVIVLAGVLAACGALAAERAIEKEIVVAAPIESVWQTWTSKAGIESFFAPEAEVDPRVGGARHSNLRSWWRSKRVTWTGRCGAPIRASAFSCSTGPTWV